MAKILFLWLFPGFLIFGLGCGNKESAGNPTSSRTPVDAAGTVAFADSHLDSAIRQALQKSGLPLTQEDLLRLTKFEAREADIAELDGIEQLENLTVLDLADNRIRDVAPLGSLTRLTFLDLSRNRIESVAPLTALADLEILVLAGNPLRNVAPLLELEKLTSLELTGCPLNDESRQVYLPDLEERGVEATFRSEAGEGDEASGLLDFEIVFIGDSRNARTDIFRMKTDGSEPVNLTDNPVYEYHSLICSPDGQRIAYVEGGDLQFFYIYSMDLESGDVARLTPRSGRRGTYRMLTWSPDGEKIALVKSYSFPSRNLSYSEIGIVGTDGSGYADLTQTAQDGLYHDAPAWSPDGERIAYGRYTYTYSDDNFEYTERGIHLIGADGSQQFRLSEWGFDPFWSPDGGRIAFARPLRYGDVGISLVDAEGGDPVVLTRYADSAPVWSPDGDQIAFVRYGQSSADVHVMSADGGPPINLTRSPFWDGEPAWSPDGKWIGFREEGNVWVVPAAGGEAINLTNQFQKSIHAFCWVP